MTTSPLRVTADVSGIIEVKHPDPPPAPAPDPSALNEEDRAVLKDARAANIASLAAFHASLTSLATASVDRARAGATAVVTAASAIATVYAGLLALVFSVDGTALPTRALLSPIFFAIAIALATAYMAFITARNTTQNVDETGGWGEKAYNRVRFFIAYTKSIVVRRVWMLQAAVIALAVAIFGIALPFVSPGAGEPAEIEDQTVSVNWPEPTVVSGDPALDALLYQAQLERAVAVADAETKLATERATASAEAAAQKSWMDTATFFWVTLGVGLALVLGIPAILALRESRARKARAAAAPQD